MLLCLKSAWKLQSIRKIKSGFHLHSSSNIASLVLCLKFKLCNYRLAVLYAKSAAHPFFTFHVFISLFCFLRSALDLVICFDWCAIMSCFSTSTLLSFLLSVLFSVNSASSRVSLLMKCSQRVGNLLKLCHCK